MTAKTHLPQQIDANPLTHADIMALSKQLKRPAETLIALSNHSDPFYVYPARVAAADWFKDVWDRLAPGSGVHLRRLHYALVSQPPETRPRKLDGTHYENTEADWQAFSKASLAARELELVDAGLFVDRRAGEAPVVYIPDDEASDAEVSVVGSIEQPDVEDLPSISYTPEDHSFPMFPLYPVVPPTIAEPYAIEVWAEKSTMNDVLVPLAEQHNVTLITGVGELSLTHCHQLVERMRVHQRATRILYISDFDPSGDNMPASVARKIEFLLRRHGLDFDIRLDPLVLTAEQVRHYRLPRIPITESDARKARFESRHGEDAVELDALEALHPGELRRIAIAAVETYREPARATRREITAATNDLRDRARDVRQEVLADHAEEIAQLRSDFDAMQATIAPHQAALEQLVEDLENRIENEGRQHLEAINSTAAAFYERAAELFDVIRSNLEDNAPDVNEVEWPEGYVADESDDQLFQSERTYLDQIARYKQHQGKRITRRPYGSGGGVAPIKAKRRKASKGVRVRPQCFSGSPCASRASVYL
jgi:hypothetical protein